MTGRGPGLPCSSFARVQCRSLTCARFCRRAHSRSIALARRITRSGVDSVPPHEPIDRARALAWTYAALTGTVAVGGALALPPGGLAVSLGYFLWIALGSLAILVPLTAWNGFWSALGAYTAVFWCFHFGLIAVLGLGLVRSSDISIWDQVWVLGPFAGDAAFVALVGLAALACGASLVKVLTWSKGAEERA